jgi:nucleoid DNA-binding protein
LGPGHSHFAGQALAISHENQKAVMKLKDINDAVATACNVRPNVVNAVQAETFKQIRVALEKGEKVMIAGFGVFVTRELPGEDGAPPKKSLRFKLRDEKEQAERESKAKEARKAKKAAGGATTGAASSDDDE